MVVDFLTMARLWLQPKATNQRSTTMPIYEFHCRSCRTDFEVFAHKSESGGRCPYCDSCETTRVISLTHYRNADHWEKDMLKGLAKSKERDKLKAELKAPA
jgi:putative FmdB family regulatory protein